MKILKYVGCLVLLLFLCTEGWKMINFSHPFSESNLFVILLALGCLSSIISLIVLPKEKRGRSLTRYSDDSHTSRKRSQLKRKQPPGTNVAYTKEPLNNDYKYLRWIEEPDEPR